MLIPPASLLWRLSDRGHRGSAPFFEQDAWTALMT